MITNFLKIIFICFLFFFQNTSYARIFFINSFQEKNFENYFSALLYFNEKQYHEAVKHFKSSKDLKEFHQNYLKKYLLALTLEGKVSKAINEIKTTRNKKHTEFFEADLLMLLDSLKNKDYEKSLFYNDKLKKYNNDELNSIIASSLDSYLRIFNKEDLNLNSLENFGNLTMINKAFLSCYMDEELSEAYFKNLINSSNGDYSRYIFFYSNYLINKKQIIKAKELVRNIDTLSSSLLILQTKKWIEEEKNIIFNKIFSCKNPNDIVSEFFFIISNIYSNEKEYRNSNFYLNISNFLNPKFKLNLSLLVENYTNENNFRKAEKILNKFTKKDDIYYWYSIKKKTSIILKKKGEEKSFKFINDKFKKINNPSLKIIFDMGNVSKNLKKYDLAIKFYSNLLLKLNSNSPSYSEVLYRRGGSYERLGEYKKADADLLKSLEINPDNPYTLNYLAYSWLERNYKIREAIEMLNKAYNQESNDPYIIDSIGWAYYLVGDYNKAESFLRRAVVLMPNDPIVNDHYADILWKLNKKIQARYFWQNVLQLEETEVGMKKNINKKLILGIKENS